MAPDLGLQAAHLVLRLPASRMGAREGRREALEASSTGGRNGGKGKDESTATLLGLHSGSSKKPWLPPSASRSLPRVAMAARR